MSRSTGAQLSDDGIYRYALWRIEDASKDLVLFVGLNPSTADATEDDPTIRRCRNFARSWGFGGILMGNLFAFRSTDPKQLLDGSIDIFGPENDRYLKRLCRRSKLVVACWGANDLATGAQFYMRILLDVVAPPRRHLFCLGRNKDGSPKHPLYLKVDTQPEPFPTAVEHARLRNRR